jgi:hypothetical protein
MKRATLALTAVAALALPAAAGADAGAASCSAHGLTWDTPGKMFQSARTDLAVNPATLAGVHGVTVGQLIAAGCRS